MPGQILLGPPVHFCACFPQLLCSQASSHQHLNPLWGLSSGSGSHFDSVRMRREPGSIPPDPVALGQDKIWGLSPTALLPDQAAATLWGLHLRSYSCWLLPSLPCFLTALLLSPENTHFINKSRTPECSLRSGNLIQNGEFAADGSCLSPNNLLRYHFWTINCIHLMSTIWWILTSVYIWETTPIVTIWNVSITSKRFLVPLSVHASLCSQLQATIASQSLRSVSLLPIAWTLSQCSVLLVFLWHHFIKSMLYILGFYMAPFQYNFYIT